MKTIFSVTLFAALLVATGCGSGSSGSGTNLPSSGGGGGGNPSGGGTGAIQNPTAVAVGGGATTSGIDITVPAVSSAPLNAKVLGTAPITSSGGSASNTGGVVVRGNQAHVLLFGTGLNGNLKVILSGPNDISISNLQTIKSTSGSSGIEFDVTVPTSAAPGARTVFLEDSKGNVTAFAGGLEIQ